MPNRSKQKGDRFEREAVKKLLDLGIPAQRVPLSGALKGEHTSDIVCTVRPGKHKRIECKVRKRAWSDLYGWLTNSDKPFALFIKADRTDTLVVMSLENFAALIKETQ